jgi:flagellar motility protein MotE (MotC chaperone)
MRRLWKVASTLFTVLGATALIAAAISWKMGWIDPAALAAQPRVSTEAPPVPAPAAAPGPVAPPAPPLNEEQAKSWFARMEELRAEMATWERGLTAREETLKRERATVHPVAEGLVEALKRFLPAEKVPAADTLVTDAQAVASVVALLKEQTAYEARVPKLLSTITEMNEEDAAALLGENLPVELSSTILEKLEPEARASILSKLVRKNPEKAGTIFARLAGEKEKG